MSTLATAADDVRAAGLTLLRATPRGDGRLLLALRTAAGEELAGQWYADPARCREVARRTHATVADDVAVRADRLLLQRHGADRRLPQLCRLVAAGGTLVAHRPERRGVVRLPDGRYTKVVRADRVAGLAGTLTRAAGWTGVRVPAVTGTGRGTVTLAPLPGSTLHDRLADPRADLPALGHAVGQALARLHAVPVPADLPGHDLAAEVAVTERWLALATEHADLPLDLDGALRVVRRRAAAHAPGRRAVLHRDLHDKQLLVDDRHGVGVLDLDLLAVGEPALDLANLLVHLELRARQGRVTGVAARTTADAVLAGYDPDPATRAALPLHARLARLRLAGVYAFRPGAAAAAYHLSTDPLLEELS